MEQWGGMADESAEEWEKRQQQLPFVVRQGLGSKENRYSMS
jgi:hypothetical protein